MSLTKMMLVPLRFIKVGNDPSEISFGVLQAEFHGAGPSEILFEVCVAASDKQRIKTGLTPVPSAGATGHSGVKIARGKQD